MGQSIFKMPRVHKYFLILLSGLMWTGVGIFLMKLATRWFSELSTLEIYFSIGGGLLLGSIIAYFGFGGLALKNISRINHYQKDRVCIWAFQKWTTYILIIFMMSLGIFMRNTPYIPKFLLCPMYIGIGSALFLASVHYYLFLFKNLKK